MDAKLVRLSWKYPVSAGQARTGFKCNLTRQAKLFHRRSNGKFPAHPNTEQEPAYHTGVSARYYDLYLFRAS